MGETEDQALAAKEGEIVRGTSGSSDGFILNVGSSGNADVKSGHAG
jgi:hypothetical protein